MADLELEPRYPGPQACPMLCDSHLPLALSASSPLLPTPSPSAALAKSATNTLPWVPYARAASGFMVDWWTKYFLPELQLHWPPPKRPWSAQTFCATPSVVGIWNRWFPHQGHCRWKSLSSDAIYTSGCPNGSVIDLLCQKTSADVGMEGS